MLDTFRLHRDALADVLSSTNINYSMEFTVLIDNRCRFFPAC